MYKACIFDLDGTLCDSVESISYSANRVLRELGLKEATQEEYKVFVGDGVNVLIRRLLRHAGDAQAVHFDEMKKRYMECFQKDCLYHVSAYPGIQEMLDELKKQGARLGVLSNKPHVSTVKVIEGIFGSTCFDCIQGQMDKLPRKPDPAGAFYVAEQLGVKPEECIYVGDTGTDMETGKAAGMYTAGVLWGFRSREELEQTGADRVIAHPSELVELYRN